MWINWTFRSVSMNNTSIIIWWSLRVYCVYCYCSKWGWKGDFGIEQGACSEFGKCYFMAIYCLSMNELKIRLYRNNCVLSSSLQYTNVWRRWKNEAKKNLRRINLCLYLLPLFKKLQLSFPKYFFFSFTAYYYHKNI